MIFLRIKAGSLQVEDHGTTGQWEVLGKIFHHGIKVIYEISLHAVDDLQLVFLTELF